MPETSIPPDRSRHLIHTLFAVQLISMGAMEMSGPFWPVHLKSLTSSELLFGFAGIAVYVGPMLGIMLTSSFWGRMGDRTGHKLMMIRALLGLSLTQLALAYTSDVMAILALRFVQGACAGFIAPAQAYGVEIEAPARRARLFAYLQVSTNVGSLCGAVLGGVILDHATFFWINFSASVLCALCALTVWVSLPDVRPSPAPAKAQEPGDPSLAQRAAWLSLPVVGMLVIIGLLLMSRMVTQTPFSLYVTTIFGVDNWVTGLCYGLMSLGFVVSASLWARYFEGRSFAEVLSRLAWVVAGCAALTLAAGLTRYVPIFIGAYFLWGILLGATTPVLMSQISARVERHRQGHVLGVAQSTTQFSSITGIALGGWFSQAAGLASTYFLVAFLYAVALLATFAVRLFATRDTATAKPLAQQPEG